MAVFGRRQPHAPLILRGGQNQKPIGRVLVVGQKTAQLAADRANRRGLTPIIIRRGGPPGPVGHLQVVGEETGQAAADKFFRRTFTRLIIGRLGARPSVARCVVAGQKTSQLSADRYFRRSFPPLLKRGGPPLPAGPPLVVGVAVRRGAEATARRSYTPVVVNRAGGPPPVAHVLVAGQKTSQLAADRYWRRQFPPLIRRLGSLGSVNRQLIVQQIAQPAARRPKGLARVFKPPVLAVTVVAPLGVTLIAGQKTSQLAADRFFRRAFPPIRRMGGPARPVGLAVVVGQKTTQLAADRYFRRGLTPVIIRRGGPPGPLGQQLIVQRVAQPAARRPKGLARVFVPPVIGATANPPVAVTFLFGQKTSQLAADRYWRRQFPPILRRLGSAGAVARQLIVQRIAQPAARRPSGGAKVFKPPVINPAVNVPVGATLIYGQKAAQAAVGKYYHRQVVGMIVGWPGPGAPVAPPVMVGQEASQANANRFFRRSFPPIIKRVIAPAAPPTAPVASLFFFGQKTAQLAADRFFRRAFPAIIKRVGRFPSVARILLAGQKTAQLAADRYFRRSFRPILKQAGGVTATARSLVLYRVSRDAARRPGSRVVIPGVTGMVVPLPPSSILRIIPVTGGFDPTRPMTDQFDPTRTLTGG